MQSENIRLPRSSLRLLKIIAKSPIEIAPSQKETLVVAQSLIDHGFVIKSVGISPEEITSMCDFFATYLEISPEGEAYLGARRKYLIGIAIAIIIPVLAAALGCLFPLLFQRPL